MATVVFLSQKKKKRLTYYTKQIKNKYDHNLSTLASQDWSKKYQY